MPSSFCRIVDTLELIVRAAAVGSGEDSSVTAKRFYAPVVAHGGSR